MRRNIDHLYRSNYYNNSQENVIFNVYGSSITIPHTLTHEYKVLILLKMSTSKMQKFRL